MSKFKPETKLILRAKKVSKQKISPKFKKRTKSPNVCCMFMHKSLLNYGIRYRAQCQLGGTFQTYIFRIRDVVEKILILALAGPSDFKTPT